MCGLSVVCDSAGGSDEEHQWDPSAIPLHAARPLPELLQVRGGGGAGEPRQLHP